MTFSVTQKTGYYVIGWRWSKTDSASLFGSCSPRKTFSYTIWLVYEVSLEIRFPTKFYLFIANFEPTLKSRFEIAILKNSTVVYIWNQWLIYQNCPFKIKLNFYSKSKCVFQYNSIQLLLSTSNSIVLDNSLRLEINSILSFKFMNTTSRTRDEYSANAFLWFRYDQITWQCFLAICTIFGCTKVTNTCCCISEKKY